MIRKYVSIFMVIVLYLATFSSCDNSSDVMDNQVNDLVADYLENHTIPAGDKANVIDTLDLMLDNYVSGLQKPAFEDIQDIVIATDAGREGELVARWILDKSGCRKPIKRLWISSVTDKAIREGFDHLKDGREYQNLYRAAAARAEADCRRRFPDPTENPAGSQPPHSP